MNRYTAAFKRMQNSLDHVCDKYDKKCKFSFYIDAMWCYIRYGVTPNEYIGFQFYNKRGIDRKRFYTARHHSKIEKHFNCDKNSEIFWKKEKFNERFKTYVKRDWCFVPNISKEEFDMFVKSHSRLIVKPQGGSSGKGIHLYDNDVYDELVSSKCLLEEFIVQHSAMSSLNSSSVNTVRVYTILDREGSTHVLSCSIRVGGVNSCVDNYHSGGVGYPVDIETGVVYMPGRGLSGESFVFHPGTNKKVVGFEIPNYSELKKFITDASHELPDSRLIAWDVAVLQDGFELVEANYAGDPGLMQAPSGVGMLPLLRKYY